MTTKIETLNAANIWEELECDCGSSIWIECESDGGETYFQCNVCGETSNWINNDEWRVRCQHVWEAFSWDENNIYCECLDCGAYGVKKCLTIDDRVELNSFKKAHIIKNGVKEIDLSKITV